MTEILGNIRQMSMRVWIIFAAIFILTDESPAGIVKSGENQKRNYQIHHRTIIFNSLSTFQNSYKYDTQDLNTGNRAGNSLLEDAGSFKGAKNITSSQSVELKRKFMLSSNVTEADNLENNGKRGLADLSVGSFLDDFKNDPATENIYFTSKDLIFSYKSHVNSILQLDMDMDQNEKDILRQFEQDKLRRLEGGTSGNINRNRGLESLSIFNSISESYITVFYILLGLILILYAFFRFFMNKYI